MIRIEETVIERETSFVRQSRNICIAVQRSGIKVWLKGKREFFVLPYDQLFIDAMRNDQRVCIPPRRVSDASVKKAVASIMENLP